MSEEKSNIDKLMEDSKFSERMKVIERSEAIKQEFFELQAKRAKEKLTAAKSAVDEALYELSGSQDGRDSEVAADAIENLIRVIMENSK